MRCSASSRRRGGGAAVLEEVDALVGAEQHGALADGDREVGLGERALDVGGHVVGALGDVAVEA